MISSRNGRCGSTSWTSRPASVDSSRQRADRGLVPLGAAPDRQRGAPVALARQGPVDVVLQPVAETAVLDVLGMPVDAVVDLEQPVLDGGRADVPGRAGEVEQRRRASPAERVLVLVRAGVDQDAAGAQVLDDRRIGVLHEETADERRRLLGEGAVIGDRPPHGPALGSPHREIVGPEGGREVDDPGAVVHRHEVRGDHGVRVLHVGVRRLVAGPHECGAVEAVRLDPIVPEDDAGPWRRDDETLAVAFVHRVPTGRQHRRALVRRQRPGRRRPHDERGADVIGVARLDDREPQEHARVLHLLVSLGDLGVGQRRAAPRAVGGDLVVLDEQPALVQPLERPPDRLDVGRGHRPVGVRHVDPESDPVRQALELTDVALHRRAAPLVERRDAERLDVALAGGADLLLHLELDRQAVAVPAALSAHEVPGHRLVARVDVLERARLHVMDARLAVGRRRPLVEEPGRARRLAPRACARRCPPRSTTRGSIPRARGRTPSDRPVRSSSWDLPCAVVLVVRGRGTGPRGTTSLAARTAAAAHRSRGS